MPNVSQAQRAAMAEAAAGHSKLGIPKKVGAEYMAEDKGGHLPARMPRKAKKMAGKRHEIIMGDKSGNIIGDY